MSFSSYEVNLLIYQYLQDSGFIHTSYNFASEAQVFESGLNVLKLPPAALINILQKGLQYAEVQNILDDDGNVKEVPNRLNLFDAAKIREELFSNKNNQTKGDSRKNDENRVIDSNFDKVVEVDSSTIEIPQSCVRTFHGHNSAVFICAWNPIFYYLATASSDSTVRIWDISDNAQNKQIILRHSSAKKDGEISKNNKHIVTCLEWSPFGQYLATGTYDGHVRLWEGKSIWNLGRHSGPIFALKFNENGNYLLSGGDDHIARIYDLGNSNKNCIQECRFHSGSILDIAWKTNDTFASCSSDKFIYVCKLHHQQPLIKFKGHTKKINAIEWNPQGTLHDKLLASCSDDKTLKIWSMDQDTCVHSFQAHTKEINTLKWLPTGLGTANLYNNLILASASNDATIRIWDAGRYVCVRTLMKHTKEVCTLAFSPDAKFLATGGNDKFLYVWLVESGLLVYSFKANAEIVDVTWNFKGDLIAVGSTDGTVIVLDLRKM